MRTNMNSTIVAAAVLALAAAVPAVSQNQTAQSIPIIRSYGEGSVQTPPDEAILEIGVTTQAPTAQEAATENASKVERILASLRKEAGPGAMLQTLSYNLNPDYRQVREGGQMAIISYTAYNILRVRFSDLTRVGRLIDQAVAVGANNVQRVDFTVKDQNRAHQEALKAATMLAMQNAEVMSSAIGMRVLRVIMLEEGASAVPYRAFAAREVMASSTQIEPGNVDIRATVTLTVEIGK